MPTQADLDRLTAEEARIQFPAFNAETAWALGSLIRARAAAEKLPVVIDITLNGQQLFFAAMPGTNPDNAEWVRRKRNVTNRFRRSSLFKTFEAEVLGRPMMQRYGLSEADYCASGGAVPILLAGTGCVGAVVVSGLAMTDDHKIIVEAMIDLLARDGAAGGKPPKEAP